MSSKDPDSESPSSLQSSESPPASVTTPAALDGSSDVPLAKVDDLVGGKPQNDTDSGGSDSSRPGDSVLSEGLPMRPVIEPWHWAALLCAAVVASIIILIIAPPKRERAGLFAADETASEEEGLAPAIGQEGTGNTEKAPAEGASDQSSGQKAGGPKAGAGDEAAQEEDEDDDEDEEPREAGAAPILRRLQQQKVLAHQACTVHEKAHRIAFAVEEETRLAVASGAESVSVGYVAPGGTAVAVSWAPGWSRPRTLHQSRVAEGVFGVQPLPLAEEGTVHVDPKNKRYRDLVTVNATQPFTVGITKHSVAFREDPDAEAVRVWKQRRAAGPIIATPWDKEHAAVAFRTLDKAEERAARVKLGRFNTSSGKGVRRWSLPFLGRDFAAPSMAQSGDTVLVVTSAALAKGVPEMLQLALVRPETKTPAVVVIRPPKGGPGGPMRNPAVASLTAGRWLLQWTEGEGEQRQVRAIALSPQLEPLGRAVSVSAQSDEVTAVAVSGGAVPAGFFLLEGANYQLELWAQGLLCQSVKEAQN